VHFLSYKHVITRRRTVPIITCICADADFVFPEVVPALVGDPVAVVDRVVLVADPVAVEDPVAAVTDADDAVELPVTGTFAVVTTPVVTTPVVRAPVVPVVATRVSFVTDASMENDKVYGMLQSFSTAKKIITSIYIILAS